MPRTIFNPVESFTDRISTANQGEPCIWRDYKAVCLHPQARMAWFQENEMLIEWVNQQPLAKLLNCVGDGHSGIGNLMARFNLQGNTREIKELVSSGREFV